MRRLAGCKQKGWAGDWWGKVGGQGGGTEGQEGPGEAVKSLPG